MVAAPYRKFLFTCLGFGLAFGVANCSLRPHAATVRVELPKDLRDNPALAEIGHFALAISGVASNSLSQSDVGNRNLSCLSLAGQISFPYTLAQLLEGVSVSVPLGQQQISIVGVSDVTSPTSIATAFLQGGVRAYLIAQGSLNPSEVSAVTLSSTYVAATATELLAACPPDATTVQGMFVHNAEMGILRRQLGVWSYDTFDTASAALPSFFLDNAGNLNAIFSRGAPVGSDLTYSRVVPPGFTRETVASYSSSPTRSAAAQASDGSIFVLAPNPTDSLMAQLFVRSGAGSFSLVSSLLTSGVGGFSRLLIEAGPNNFLIAASAAVSPAGVVSVRVRDSLGVWSSPSTINAAGAQGCGVLVDNVNIAVDANGFGHVTFRCLYGTSSLMGYATNRSGSWVSSSHSTELNINFVAMDLDSAGKMHAVYGVDSGIRYLTGSASTGTWTTPSAVQGTNGTLGEMVVVASANDVVTGIGTRPSGVSTDIIPINLENGTIVSIGGTIVGKSGTIALTRKLEAY